MSGRAKPIDGSHPGTGSSSLVLELELHRMDERSTKIAELLMKKPRPTTRSSGSPTAPMTTGHPGIRTGLSRSELPELLGTKVVRSELTYLLVRQASTPRPSDGAWSGRLRIVGLSRPTRP
jgi:hypothetical protein